MSIIKKIFLGMIALGLVLLLVVYLYNSYQDEKKAEQVAAEQYAVAHPLVSYTPATPLAEGTTPCTLHVGWGTIMKTGGRPALVKYHGKTKWIRLSGRENDKITLDQFSPGNAEFASPPEDTTPVQVQIYPPER